VKFEFITKSFVIAVLSCCVRARIFVSRRREATCFPHSAVLNVLTAVVDSREHL
jgi:hypothetical protein